ncbi:DUF6082 family protein [Actinoplanes oblitus]|uniref:DUF6082 family protein n=1 Tax=Actinoplanes oblitus TaxID=3040509 RepID=A0ABY8WAG4_9ACTN|nr:DUF6082 family protein [Actinoplanes oblitus]WIM93905.1 DUF6082 family protein [Actinoplanes oblitus]
MAVLLVVVLVLVVPIVMIVLSGAKLDWERLADVGDTFAGASAVLSAIALVGVGASLLFQQRQIRQEFADLDRQQHVELMRMAIDNPEFIEVLDCSTVDGEHPRHEIYANLVLMYWLAIWQLGALDDGQLRMMAANMFRSPITRQWWSRVGDDWIGTRNHPERRWFMEMITAEHRIAMDRRAASPAADERPAPRNRRRPVSLSAGIAVGGLLAGWLLHARRKRSS